MILYEDVFLSHAPEKSNHVAALFQRSGIPFRERIDTENGVEYVISVPSEHYEQALAIFWEDVGPAKSYTSGGGNDGSPK